MSEYYSLILSKDPNEYPKEPPERLGALMRTQEYTRKERRLLAVIFPVLLLGSAFDVAGGFNRPPNVPPAAWKARRAETFIFTGLSGLFLIFNGKRRRFTEHELSAMAERGELASALQQLATENPHLREKLRDVASHFSLSIPEVWDEPAVTDQEY